MHKKPKRQEGQDRGPSFSNRGQLQHDFTWFRRALHQTGCSSLCAKEGCAPPVLRQRAGSSDEEVTAPAGAAQRRRPPLPALQGQDKPRRKPKCRRGAGEGDQVGFYVNTLLGEYTWRRVCTAYHLFCDPALPGRTCSKTWRSSVSSTWDSSSPNWTRTSLLSTSTPPTRNITLRCCSSTRCSRDRDS